MNTCCSMHVDTGAAPADYERVLRQLRAAAVHRRQTEARQQWIRAATRC